MVGELIGGLDIIREMAAEGELDEAIPHIPKKTDINERIEVGFLS